MGAHQRRDLLGVGRPDHRGAGGGDQLGLVQLLVAADHGHHRLVVGDVDQGLELAAGRDAVGRRRQGLDGDHARRGEPLRRGEARAVRLGRQARGGGLGVGGVAAPRAGRHQVLAGVGPDHELGGLAAAHGAGVSLHRHELQAAAGEDPLVGPPLVLVAQVEAGPVHVEGVGVLHGELADPEQAGLGPGLVAELGLDLVPDLRQLPVAAQLGPGDGREDLLVRHAQAVVAALPVLEPEHVVAHHLPAARLLPDLGRVEGGEEELLAADGVHLLADDGLDLVERTAWRAAGSRRSRPPAGG